MIQKKKKISNIYKGACKKIEKDLEGDTKLLTVVEYRKESRMADSDGIAKQWKFHMLQDKIMLEKYILLDLMNY